MLDRIFNYDNGFWQAMGTCGDLLLLNALAVLLSLPLLTAGAAIPALYYVLYKIIERENSGTLRNFFRSFRQNLRQGIILTLVLAAMGLILCYDLLFARALFLAGTGAVRILSAALGGFLLFLYLTELLYVFPLQARFYNPVSVTLKNALLLGVIHLPRTILMLLSDGAVLGVSVLCFRFAPQLFVLPLLLGFPLSAYLKARLLQGILGLEPGRGERPQEDEAEQL